MRDIILCICWMVIGVNLGCTISNIAKRKTLSEFAEALQQCYDKMFVEIYRETDRLQDENEKLTNEIEKLRYDEIK